METAAEIQKTAHPSSSGDGAPGWSANPAEQAEERAFPGAVVPDQTEALSLARGHRHIPECPERFRRLPPAGHPPHEGLLQRVGAIAVQPKLLPHRFRDERVRHSDFYTTSITSCSLYR